MPFVGPVFSIPTNEFYPAIEDTVLDPEAWNSIAEDLANGLTAVVTRDGAGSMNGSLNMGSNKIVSVAAATNPGDAPRFDQITPADPTLIAIGTLSFAANDMFYATGPDTFALFTTSANGRSLIGAADYAAMRTQLSLGTAALKNTGTSGNNVPLLDGANTWSATQTEANNVAWSVAETGGTSRAALKMDTSNNIEIGNANNNSEYLGAGHAFSGAVANFTINGVVVADVSSAQSLSNKTLSSPTISGGVLTGTFTGSAMVMSGTNPITIGAADTGAHYLKWTNNGGNAFVGVDSSTGGSLLSGAAYALCILTESSRDIYFGTNNTTRLIVTSGGDVVGTSVGPTSVYSLGYRGCPYNNQNANYTFVLADAGAFVFANVGGPFAYTIPPNSSVAYPIGTTIIVGCGNGVTLTVAEGSGVTLFRFDGVSGTGTRTVAQNGSVTLYKFGTNTWLAMGNISA